MARQLPAAPPAKAAPRRMRTCYVTKLALTRDGTRAREVRISLGWSPDFGTEATDDRQPQRQQSQKRAIEPHHKRRQPST